MPSSFGVVDLFAGPGGLGEGFASLMVGNRRPFQIGISIEKEASAHRTLRLRAFLRAHRARHGSFPNRFLDFHAGSISEPDWADVDETAWTDASEEALCLELGSDAAAHALDRAIRQMRLSFDDTILIGGPPCQAYSLVGRARSRGNAGYVPEDDSRHYLFREYIRVLDRLRPAAFVMENVKGMLSSTVESRLVFEMLMEDLASLGTGRGHHYELRAVDIDNGRVRLRHISNASDFIVRSEDFGVPQRRHRLIIVGIRSDLPTRSGHVAIRTDNRVRTVSEVIGNLPPLRSGISRSSDSAEAWRIEVARSARHLTRLFKGRSHVDLQSEFRSAADLIPICSGTQRSSTDLPEAYSTSDDELRRWIERPELRALAQHETRTHMPSDLGRYLFSAVFGKVRGYSPKAADFPSDLSPAHRNWNSGVFNDRFRVQLAHEPSTTVTSHIAKDGHYFIHPDPLQCRSLTVREAARLQTFPDDYLFLGNRTQQYTQVGNAVPPFLARQIAAVILSALSVAKPRDLDIGLIPDRARLHG